jgi:hypothetical protein
MIINYHLLQAYDLGGDLWQGDVLLIRNHTKAAENA